MTRYQLYTYKDLNEFNKIYEQLEKQDEEVIAFRFQETHELLRDNENVTIDISNLVLYLMKNPSDTYSAAINFEYLDASDKVIVRKDLADFALSAFNTIFFEAVPYFTSTDEVLEEKLISVNAINQRKILYSYRIEQFDEIIKNINKIGNSLISFSKINSSNDLKDFISNGSMLYVDITSLIQAIASNPQLVYFSEQYFNASENCVFIIRDDQVEAALKAFHLTFKHSRYIGDVLKDFKDANTSIETPDDRLIRVIDLDEDRINRLQDRVCKELFGHEKFKSHFKMALKNFLLLNKINKKKILSIFLLGPSGLGKTEFATIIKNELKEDTPFTKINFGNYSSKEALNSLIGSPKGYIGSEDGELSVKVIKSKAGVILCDEFEKANFPIFNFFLELLEDGKFTDSVSREFDLNGYIIIFTSNLDEQKFYQVIPPELQSRLDLVCEFRPLNSEEKKQYVSYYVNNFVKELESKGNIQSLPQKEIKELMEINVENIENLREINRIITNKIMELI